MKIYAAVTSLRNMLYLVLIKITFNVLHSRSQLKKLRTAVFTMFVKSKYLLIVFSDVPVRQPNSSLHVTVKMWKQKLIFNMYFVINITKIFKLIY